MLDIACPQPLGHVETTELSRVRWHLSEYGGHHSLVGTENPLLLYNSLNTVDRPLVVGVPDVHFFLDLEPAFDKFNGAQHDTVDKASKHPSLHRLAECEITLGLHSKHVLAELVGGKYDRID